MNWLNKLERKFGNWAIPNLIVWLIGAYTIGFVLYQVNPSIIGLLMLSPYHILHGQVWRLITWVFMPTDTNLVYLLIMALFYYQLGTTLERTWGTFRFNVYIFGGMLFTVIGAFLLYGIMYLFERRCDDGDASDWNKLQHKLHQHVHLPCVCMYVSGYAGSSDVHYPD